MINVDELNHIVRIMIIIIFKTSSTNYTEEESKMKELT